MPPRPLACLITLITLSPGLVAGLPDRSSGLPFIENRGSFDSRARFVAPGDRIVTWFIADGLIFQMFGRDGDVGGASLFLTFEGSEPDATPRGVGVRQQVCNLIFGDDPSGWKTELPTYDAVRYDGLLPGLDLLFHGADGSLEYDLVVSDESLLAQLVLRCEGAENIEIAAGGALHIHTAVGVLVHSPPRAYQAEILGTRVPIDSRFVRIDDTRFGLSACGATQDGPIVLDPYGGVRHVHRRRQCGTGR